MVDKLQVEIGIDGAEEVNQRLLRIQQTTEQVTRSVVNFILTLGRAGRLLTEIGAVATLAAAGALVKFAQAASQTEKALSQLQATTGQSFENLSALQQVFAAGGTSAKDFASSMANVAKASADVAQKIRAQNALIMFGPQQGKALIDWANDVDALSQHYQHLGEAVLGVGNRTTEGLTTIKAQTDAVLNALAKVPAAERQFKLADLLRGLSAEDAIRVGEALKLTATEIAQLRQQGSTAMRALVEERKVLGLTLTQQNQQDLQTMTEGWNQFTSLTGAAFNKLGAAVAPAFARLAATANTALLGIIEDFEKLPENDAIANLGNRLGPVFEQAFRTLGPIVAAAGKALGVVLIEGIAIGIWNSASLLNQAIDALLERAKNAISSIFSTPSSQTQEQFGGGMAGGGLIAGHGTGTSDSNLVWVSRGEHIMPASAVAKPGMLAFLEALRRSGGNLSRVIDGMGHFALGGLMLPRFADGGLVGANVTIQFPGVPPISGLRASAAVVDELRHAAALAQVRSGGRKPSRYS